MSKSSTDRVQSDRPNSTVSVAESDVLKSGKNDNRTKPLSDGVFNFVDSNIRWIRYGVYSVGVVGVFLIIRGTYSAKVFRRVSDLPSHYISRHVTLQGVVQNVGADCSLHVRHTPIIATPSFLTRKQSTDTGSALPVHLAGIEASPVGRKWLVDNVKGQHVWFKLMERSSDCSRVDCAVMVKKGYFVRKVLNEELIKLELCRLKVFPSPPVSPTYNKLLERMVAMEARADRKSMSGIRRFSKNVKDLLLSVVYFPGRLKSYFSNFRKK